MKKKYIVLVIFFIVTSGISKSQAKSDSTTILLQNRIDSLYQVIHDQNKELQNHRLSAVIEYEVKEEFKWYMNLFGIAIAVIAILFGLLQYYFTQKASDNIYRKLAKTVNKDKHALKRTIEFKTVEMELKSDYPIVILSDNNTDEPRKIEKLLTNFQFENVTVCYLEELKDKKFDNKKTIFVLHYKEINEEKISDNKDLFKNRLIGIWKQGDEVSDGINELCAGYSNSYGRLYENIISLLHYKRYQFITEDQE